MTPISASDVSLYELALTTDPPPPVLQVSPSTLKSVFSAFIDLLTEQELAAVVWAKLPRGSIWQAELEQYSTLTDVPSTIYVFKNHREDGEDGSGPIDPATATDSSGSHMLAANADNTPEGDAAAIDADPVLAAPTHAPPPNWINIQLAPESHLRREYFLLVWTAKFRGLIVAHRPRSAQVKTNATSSAEANLLLDPGTINAVEDTHERRQHLLVMASFDPVLIETVLGGLANASTVNPASTAIPESAIAKHESGLSTLPLAEAVLQWQRHIATLLTPTIDPTTLGHLFTKQIQRQEDAWQRNASYRRQAETAETLQLHNEELSNALRSREDFINTVGQELRTPLTTIKTALSLLNSPNLKPPQRQRYMDLIAQECDRQSSLITSLLDLVQIDQVADQTVLQSIRVSDVVPGVVSTYQPLAEEKGVRLAYTVPEDLPAIACMGNWLKQIVINLLHNGIKFTPQGGQVWVRAKQQGNYINLEFRDTGIGMAPNELPKIFDRFYRIRQASMETTSGAGLGLTIVQQLIIHCGGSISVKSKPGEGSTFSVLLPIHPGSPPPSGL